MRSIIAFFLPMLAVSALLPGCASTKAPRVVSIEEPRLILVGMDGLPKDFFSSRVFVEFEGSHSITQWLRPHFIEKGVRVVESATDADYVATFTGTFSSKGKFNIAPMALGPVFDDSDAAKRARNLTIGTHQRNAIDGGAIAIGAEAFRTGYFNQMGAGIVDAISKSAGINGWVNDRLVGDPRGICFKDCEDREFSRQRVHVELLISRHGKQVARFGRAAEAYQPQFIPDKLIRMALAGTVGAIQRGEEE